MKRTRLFTYKWVVRSLLTVFTFILVFLLISDDANAQCAMCRATVESTLSEGNVGIAAKLNTGILYLFAIPYLLVSVVGVLWYKKSRKNLDKNRILERRKEEILKLK